MSKILHSLGPMRSELLLCPGRVPTRPTHTKGRSPYRESVRMPGPVRKVYPPPLCGRFSMQDAGYGGPRNLFY